MKNYNTKKKRKVSKVSIPDIARNERNEYASPVWRWVGLPRLFMWLQVIFRLSTVGKLSWPFVGYGIIFSIAYGCFFEFLVSLIKNKKAYVIVKAIVIAVITILVVIWYFIFCKFGAPYYDWNTATAGAGGVFGEFGKDIITLVFGWNGIFHLFLFFAPFIIYLVLIRKLENEMPLQSWLERGIGIGVAVVLYLVAFVAVRFVPLSWDTYAESYSITNAVDRFGFYTGLRLEIKNVLFPKKEGFSGLIEGAPDIVNTELDDTEVEIEYGYNELDIDFNALAETTSNSALSSIDEYVAAQTPSKQNKYTGLFEGKNLIFITAEAFTAQAIDPELTPTLYRLANKGFQFTDYYQPSSAGTTGGEYSNVFGMLPTAGGKSFKNTAKNLNYMTMGYQLNKLGYWGKAYHNNSYTFYSRNETHINLGYSEGFMGWGNGMENYIEKKTWPESDLEMMEGTLQEYINQDHFNVYYMSVSGHCAYGFNNNAMSKRYKDLVADMEGSEMVRAYKACNIDLDRGLEAIVKGLEQAGKLEDTVIVIAADHYPYGLDDGDDSVNKPYLKELYGVDSISNNWVQDQNRLIIWSGALEADPELAVEISSPTSSLDILPTLMNLFGIEYDSRLCVGRDVFAPNQDALTFNMSYDWKTNYGTYIKSKGVFTPTEEGQSYPYGLRDGSLVTSNVTEDEYISYIKSVVKNKITYCKNVLDNNYYKHVFPEG